MIDGKTLGITMLDFWKYQYSNIYDIQEYIAEFIVGKALGINEPCNRDGWTQILQAPIPQNVCSFYFVFEVVFEVGEEVYS